MSNFIDNLAEIFSPTNSYKVGDRFLHDEMLYEVTNDFTGPFDSSKVKPLYLSELFMHMNS